MKINRLFKTKLTCVFLILCLSNFASAKETKYTIATASTGGTFYPVGVGIATIASLKLAKTNNLTFSAITSAGSLENIDMMDKSEANFSILQGLFGSMAYQGKGYYSSNPKKNLRSITMLWQNVEQFTVSKNFAPTGNIKDLKNLYNERFSISGRNSGSKVSAEVIMDALQIDYNKMNLQYLGYSQSSTALQDGKISGMNTPSGVPTLAVTNAFASIGNSKIKVLNFSDEDLKNVNNAYPVWTRFVIKAGTYPQQNEDINTIAQPNILVVTKDTPEETVYLLTKTIFENLPFLNTVHKATKAMSLENAIIGSPMPLHKGAIRYFKEKGIKIPKNLIVD